MMFAEGVAFPLLLLLATTVLFSLLRAETGPRDVAFGPEFRAGLHRAAQGASRTRPLGAPVTRTILKIVGPTMAKGPDGEEQEPLPLPPLPPVRDAPIRITANTLLSSQRWHDLHERFQCWSWFGRWVAQPKNSRRQYRWTPDPSCGSFANFNDKELCAPFRNRKVRFVGDSLTQEHFRSVAFQVCDNATMKSVNEKVDTDPDEQGKWVFAFPKFTHCLYCDKAELGSVRTDRILVDTNPNRTLGWGNLDWPWTEDIRGFDGIVILNRGAHFRPLDMVLKAFREALAFIRKEAPRALVIYRTTAPGHKNCHQISEPLNHVQWQGNLPYSWAGFWEQNANVTEMIHREFPGVAVVDVAVPTALRGDGHNSYKNDCLHYAIHEPYSAWNDILVNTLIAIDDAVAQEKVARDRGNREDQD